MSLSCLGRCIRFNRILDTHKIYYVSVTGRRYKTKEVLAHKESSETVEKVLHAPKFFEEILDVKPRQQKRKPKIQPVVKNFFVSKVDPEILPYPEVLAKDDLLALDDRLDRIDSVIGDLAATDDSILETFKNQRIMDAPLTVFRGGLEANCTEKMRFLEEISRFRTNVAMQLNTQWSSIEVIKSSFTNEGFDLLSSQLAQEKCPVRILYRERISEDIDKPDIRMTSTLSPSGQWTLSGEKLMSKTMEVNPSKEFLVVLSCVQHNFLQGFLVYPNAPGVTYDESGVEFKDTPATMLGDDVLKKVMESLEKDEFKILPLQPINKGLAQMRLGEATITLGLLKESLCYVLDQVKGKYFSNKNYAELPLFEDLVADATTVIYKAESMIYMTAGLEDGYEDPDTEIESILCRIYTTRETIRLLQRFLNDLTPFGIQGGLEGFMTEAKEIMYNERNDWLGVYCSSLGLAHAGFQMKELVERGRNPAFYPLHALKKMFNDRRQANDNPVLNMKLENYFHQSFMDGANHLEYCIARISYAVESAFIHYGQNLLDQHKDLLRLNDIMIEVYAMLASLSRGSRAYCIGVQNSNKEIIHCLQLAMHGRYSVQRNVTDIAEGKFINGDECINNIAQKSVKLNKSFAEHPLTRVFF